MEHFKLRKAVKWGLNIFAPNYQKAHPYYTPNLIEQIVWRIWQWRCFDTIRRQEKSTRESPLENPVVYNTTSRCRDRFMFDRQRTQNRLAQFFETRCICTTYDSGSLSMWYNIDETKAVGWVKRDMILHTVWYSNIWYNLLRTRTDKESNSTCC